MEDYCLEFAFASSKWNNVFISDTLKEIELNLLTKSIESAAKKHFKISYIIISEISYIVINKMIFKQKCLMR